MASMDSMNWNPIESTALSGTVKCMMLLAGLF
jgi:hypothetical protein